MTKTKQRIEKRKLTHNEVMAKLQVGHTWKGNILQKIAEDVIRFAIPPEEVLKNDLSERVLKEIEREIKNNELVKIQVNAKTRLGKSTLAILLGLFIDNVLKKYEKKAEKDEFSISNICRDQNEYLKRMRNPDLMNDVLITDENNKSENTGENATVEQAQRETISDVQAGRYVHSVFVCPEGTMDANTDIKIEIRNREKGLVHTRISYNMKSQYYWGWVLIGSADFDVKELIKNWLNVEPRFMRYLKYKEEKDRKYIEYWSKRDFYIQYMIKKYEKMELMNREGIMHSRDLDYAEIRHNVINDLKSLAGLTFISLQRLANNVASKIESEFRKKKMPLSIIGKDAECKRIIGFLGLYRSKAETIKNIEDLKIKMQKGKISENQYHETMAILQEAKEELGHEIKQQEETLERFIKLNKKYNEIL